MFKRKIESELNAYFIGPRNKILIVDGARQIGKSYIIRKLGKEHFRNYIEINLRDDADGERCFEPAEVKTATQFYYALSSLRGDRLGNKDDTLVFLDGIQTYPHILSLLKTLNLDARYTYIASGSLLGVTLKHTFIPMGAIRQIKMHQLDFEEFLWSSGVGADVIDYLRDCYRKRIAPEENAHQVMMGRFKEYLLCGGLPDAAKAFLFEKNIMAMRTVQEEIYSYYKDDCSAYDREHKLKISRIYSMMPSYMANKVSRVRANKIEGNKKDTLLKFEDEFDYLVSSGMANEVRAISDPKFPLVASLAKNLIKLYCNDVGILTDILYKNNIDAVLNKEKGMNLGSVYETLACSELSAHGHDFFISTVRRWEKPIFCLATILRFHSCLSK